MSETKRVLVIDDESDIRDGATRWLQAAGYETLTAGDGEEGATTAAAEHPDAILLDVMMPKLDGMGCLARLRANEASRSIPVIMLSASLRDEQRALDAGARFFVTKPYAGKSLVSAVRASLDQPVLN